jgi:hypothetical protein
VVVEAGAEVVVVVELVVVSAAVDAGALRSMGGAPSFPHPARRTAADATSPVRRRRRTGDTVGARSRRATAQRTIVTNVPNCPNR